MQKHIGPLWIIGFFGFIASANAQTASPPAANTQFDGTYAFVSSTKVNEMYTRTGTNLTGRCPEKRKAGPLNIANGKAQYSSAPGYDYEGTVGPKGDLTMRLASPAPDHKGLTPGIEIMVNGRIDGNGTFRARRTDYRYSYDFVWQKQPQ